MKYFTAELYQQFNSFDVDEAERADEAWDKAEATYKERLARIREHMPSQVVKLSELCLHDALVVSRVEQAEPAGAFDFFDGAHPGPLPFVWTAVAIIAVTLGEEVISLISQAMVESLTLVTTDLILGRYASPDLHVIT